MNRDRPSVDVVAIFGTRPEIIKLGPVIAALRSSTRFSVRSISTGQHRDLQTGLRPAFDVRPELNLGLMLDGEPYLDFIRRAVAALVPHLESLRPRLVIVQGDTSSALAGALAATCAGIPVAHVEAGLRTGDFRNPYPEEAIRVMISHCASVHCAPTTGNAALLRAEGIASHGIRVTGNPVVDGLGEALRIADIDHATRALVDGMTDSRLVLLTTHRRENIGSRLDDYLEVIRRFIDNCAETHLVVPVHPNPEVTAAVRQKFHGQARTHLLDPLPYADFLYVLQSADLALSDSGGVQEEAASLGTPLIVLREKTERPEALATGTARLATNAQQLSGMLDDIQFSGNWPSTEQPGINPFGDGHSAARIVRQLHDFLL